MTADAVSGLTFIFVEASLISAGWLLLRRRGSRSLKRLGRYFVIPSGRGVSAIGAGKPSVYQAMDTRMERVPVLRSLFNYIEQQLAMANLPLKTSEFLTAILILMIAALVLQIFLAGGYTAQSPVILVGVPVMSFGFLKLRIRIRMGRIRKQLKLAISLLANHLKSGNSFVQALRQVTDDLDEPLKGEFELLLNENRLGISMEDALNSMVRRVPCKELRTLVQGVMLQHETGSNLVYILKTIHQTLQDRDDLRNKISVLTVQGKLSGVVCVAIPFLLFWLMHKTQPGYADVMVHTETGRRLLMLCGMLILVGSFFILRVVRFKY